jgi:hypothetical protein
MKILHFDLSRLPSLNLKLRRVNEDDLSLFSKYDLKDWNDEKFNLDIELRLGQWVTNEDKTVIFLPLGGGAFEIPEMYDLIVDEIKVRIWCGGGGEQARSYRKNADQSYENTIFVSEIWIPSVLSNKQDAVLELVVDAFAALYANSVPLTVEFKLISIA